MGVEGPGAAPRSIDQELAPALIEALFNQAPVGFALYDTSPQFVCLRHNEPFLRLVGSEWRARGSIAGVPLRALFSAEFGEQTAAVFASVLSTGEPFEIPEYPAVLLPETEPRYYRWTLTPLQAGAGQTLALLVSAVEITEQVYARKKVENQRRQLAAIFRHSPIGMALIDSERRYSLINTALATINGLSVEDHLGHSPEELFGHDFPLTTLITSAISGATLHAVDHFEMSIPQRADRAPGIYNILFVPLRDEADVFEGLVTFVEDMTEMERNERLRDNFLSMASHELKTPVTSLLGFAQLLQRRGEQGGVEASTLKAYSVIAHQSQRLAELINELLEVSRIRAGRLELNMAPCDLARIARAAGQDRAVIAERHHITFEGPDPAPGSGDSTAGNWDAERVEQVLLNLIDNALKYSPRGGEIRVRVWSDAEGAHCTITDEGIGVPPEALPHLFEPWFRARNANVGSHGGLGLGLYISHEIAQAHGGSLTAANNPTRGATFRLTLPQRDYPIRPALYTGERRRARRRARDHRHDDKEK